MNNFLAHNDEIRKEILSKISKSSVDDLFEQIPLQARMQGLQLNEPLSELQVQKKIKALAKKNNTDLITFLGAGVYNKFIPAAISQVAQRFEFLTAYTPYQPEISQGSLQIMYEYQTMICRLTGMDIANASVYDGATACAEAILMASRISKKQKAIVLNTINPEYKDVIKTYTWASGIEINWCDEIPQETSDYACVLIQNPNFYGEIQEILPQNTLLIVCADLASLGVIEPPRCADIVVGDIQGLGIPMSFGGPHAGFMACKEKYMRQLPGRLAGRTVDADGKQAFTLTIQTREQHIKREKATSNICSNQALIALCATLYLSLVGEKGFKQASLLSMKHAHVLAKKLTDIGIPLKNTNFFNEFVIETKNSDEVLQKLRENGIVGGLKLNDKEILVCATEMNTEDEIELYVNTLKN